VRFWGSIEDEGIPPAPPNLDMVPRARGVLQVLTVDHELTYMQKITSLRLAWDSLVLGVSRRHHPLWPVTRLLLEAVRGLPRDEVVSALSAAFQHVAARAPAEVLR
jgi:hypothetical protein